jgi:hypothetical protein
MIKDQMTFNFILSKYKDSIKEVLDIYKLFMGFYYPNNVDRVDLMTRLWGTQLSEGIYILNYLHRSLELKGDVCEFGVAQGATSAFLANEIKNTNKNIWLFDTFTGLPKPSDKDILKDDIFKLGSIEAYKGTMACKENEVKERLNEINFPIDRTKIISGLIEDIIKENKNLPDKICFAYVDFDFYSPILTALNYLDNHLLINGYVVIDDYDFFSTGSKAAVDEFLDNNKNKYDLILPFKEAGKFCIIKKIK